jgi:TM2 domain-containing membrane protein YozV
MSKALTRYSRRGGGSGIVPAVCSAVVPGVGQLLNGEADKAIGVFVVAGISGLGFLGAIPLLGSVAGLVYAGTWLYGVGDAYLRGRRG